MKLGFSLGVSSLALRRPAGSIGAASRLLVAGNHGVMATAFRTATSGLVRGEFRRRFDLCGVDQSELVFAFSNYSFNLITEENAGNTADIEAYLENSAGTAKARITFGGQNVGTMANGQALMLSDPLLPSALGLTKWDANSTWFLRFSRAVPLNGRHTTAAVSQDAGEFGVYNDGSIRQIDGLGNFTAPGGTTNTTCDQGFLMVLGRSIGAPDISVAVLGDSIADGRDDTITRGAGLGGGGWIARGLFSVNGRKVGYTRFTLAGAEAVGFSGSGLNKMAEAWSYFTHGLVNPGTNDLNNNRTPATVHAARNAIAAKMKAAGIRRVEGVLIMPRVSGTFTTVAGQTPMTGFETGGTRRDPLNALIVAGATSNGFDAVFDPNPTVSDGAQPDRWLANHTNDGTHLTPTASIALGTAVSARAATWT